MKKKFTHEQLLRICICAFFLILISVGCRKSDGNTKMGKPPLDSISQQNILKIAPSREKFNEWVDTVFKYKFEASLTYTIDMHTKYNIEKVTFTQLDSFKIAEVFIKTDQSTFNFFIGTLFNFIQAPNDKQYVLKPITAVPTPARTLIFSSDDNAPINMTYSRDTIYTFKTDRKHLFFLGVM